MMEALQRRSTTIVAADLAGYSRLMAADEDRVIQRLRDLRREVIEPEIARASGRILKTMGDGLLIEFPDARAAVGSALSVQTAMASIAAMVAPDQRFLFRIGINSGNAVIDGDEVLGDAVSIAGRLESLAPPGGICISRPVFEAMGEALPAAVTSLGLHYVKNLPMPFEVWRVEVAGITPVAALPVADHDRPSVAVLAFEAPSSTPETVQLADGLADDVITQLSRFRSLFVVAGVSSFAYRDSAKDVRQIGRELGVKYLITGALRQSGPRLRLDAQLIEAETGIQVWNGRWDRELRDIFALQDDLTRAVITGVSPELGAHERNIARLRPTDNLNAWELCQRGLVQFHAFSSVSYPAAHRLLHQASAADPEFALPRALLGRWHAVMIFSGRTRDVAAEIGQGMDHALAAIRLDDRLEDSYIALALLNTAMGREADARRALARALALNDNHPGVYQAQTFINLFQPEPDPGEMEAAGQMALRLSPNDPSAWAFHWAVTCARWIRDGHMGENVREPLEAACRLPQVENFTLLAGAVMNLRLGNTHEAKRLLQAALIKKPDLTLASHIAGFRFPYWPKLMPTIMPEYEQLVELGLPRGPVAQIG